MSERPIDMLLWCPRCLKQHIDAPSGEWHNPPHRTHACQFCGLHWRPSNHTTNGVRALEANEGKHIEPIMSCNPRIWGNRPAEPASLCIEAHNTSAARLEGTEDGSVRVRKAVARTKAFIKPGCLYCAESLCDECAPLPKGTLP